MDAKYCAWIWRGVVCGVLCGWPSVATGQNSIPESFTNLQILDDDISRPELLQIMRTITSEVGAGFCSYCHTVSDALDQPDDDFASDEKPTKVKARAMLRMVQVINDDHLAELPHRIHRSVDVTCATCHAGRPRPTTLVHEMSLAAEQGGAEALRARYALLREQYYGRGAFDFGPTPLEEFARRTGRSDPLTALTAVDLNLEYHPGSVQSWLLKGQIHALRSETGAAIVAYQRSLDLVPDNPLARQELTRLRESANGVEALSFMVGCWAEEPGSPNGLREVFVAPASNMMTGLSQYWRDGQIVDFRIEGAPGGPVLTPHPRGVASVSFRPVELDSESAVWENLEHDFPQRITYLRVARDTLKARISGGEGDTARSIEWRMSRMACPGSGT